MWSEKVWDLVGALQEVIGVFVQSNFIDSSYLLSSSIDSIVDWGLFIRCLELCSTSPTYS